MLGVSFALVRAKALAGARLITAGNFKFEISNLKLYMPLPPIRYTIYDIRATNLGFGCHWEPPFLIDD